MAIFVAKILDALHLTINRPRHDRSRQRWAECNAEKIFPLKKPSNTIDVYKFGSTVDYFTTPNRVLTLFYGLE